MATNSKSKSAKTQKAKPKSAAEKKAAHEDLQAKKRLGYEDSSQFKHWLFSNLDIINTKRLESFHNEISYLKQHCPDFLTKYMIPSNEDYLRSLSYYAKEIIQICRKFNFPVYVSCTAVTYFKRFFLNKKYNLINIDAMCMKDTAIYLASKTEQSLFKGVDQLTRETKTPSSQVVNYELVLMDGISFQLKVWNPFRPFRSFCADFKIYHKKTTGTLLKERYAEQIFKQGNYLIQDAFISDVCLIYTPSQIALSCLLLVISCIDIKKQTEEVRKEVGALKTMSIDYFKYRFGEHKDFVQLKETTKIIQHMIIDGINKTNSNKKYKKLEKEANTKMFKLQTLYYAIKNPSKKVKEKGNKASRNKDSMRNVQSKTGNVDTQSAPQINRKKKIKLKIKNKKRKKSNQTSNNHNVTLSKKRKTRP